MIKHLFFSITILNLSSSLFCMQGILRNIRKTAAPIRLTLQPQLLLSAKRTLIYDLLESYKPFFEDTNYKPLKDGPLSNLEHASEELSDPSKINEEDLGKDLYFVKISSEDRPTRYFHFDEKGDINDIAKADYTDKKRIYFPPFPIWGFTEVRKCQSNYYFCYWDDLRGRYPYPDTLISQKQTLIRWFCYKRKIEKK